jgi:hypothetical protein
MSGPFMSRHPPACILVFALALHGAAGSHAQESGTTQQDRLVLLDGTTITRTITSIDSDGMIVFGDADQPLELNGLRRIERVVGSSDGGSAVNQRLPVVIELLGGGRLNADHVTIADELCTFQGRYGTLSLQLDTVRLVRLRAAQRIPAFEEAAGSSAEFDRLFVQADERLLMIKGFIEELGDENVVFQWQEERQAIPRAKLFGIVLASVGSAPDHAGQCLLELDDGSSVWGTIESLEPGGRGQSESLMFQIDKDAALAIPWDCVSRVSVQSDRLVYLSDLTPAQVDEEPVVAFPRTWQRDKSVGRRTLTLGSRTFAKGIGVQARSQLVFSAGEEFALMTATIGIDAETGGRGDCLFIVDGDGEELFRKRVKGSDPPSDLRVDIQGVKDVTLLVDPGEALDLGDHANWCDACFIRPSE